MRPLKPITDDHRRVLRLLRFGESPMTSRLLAECLWPERHAEPIRKRASHAAMLAVVLRRRGMVVETGEGFWKITPRGWVETLPLDTEAAAHE
jgi:hypothetical protein